MKNIITEWTACNTGNTWTDEDIELVLSAPPLSSNFHKIGRAIGRSYKAIEFVYIVASTPVPTLKETGRWSNPYIRHIARVSRKVGWRKGWGWKKSNLLENDENE